MIVFILIVAGLAVFAGMALMNKNSGPKERQGIVTGILSKDALSVDFGDGKNSVVKFYGISIAHETAMQDDKIDEFFEEHVSQKSFRFKPHGLGNGDVLDAGIYSMADEYVNAILVRQGLARWVPSQASEDSALMKAQEEAKANQVGLWNPAVQELMKAKQEEAAAEVEEEVES